jgi:hypothetical protein
MKTLLVWIFIGMAVTCRAASMTIDEYSGLPAAEKIRVLQGKPEHILNDPTPTSFQPVSSSDASRAWAWH